MNVAVMSGKFQYETVIQPEPSDGFPEIWTVGHSTRPIDEFVRILEKSRIEVLADVRQFAGSRKYPQYNKENLAESLREAGIEYFHCVDLGGRRRSTPDSKNSAWRNESFRAYADYMETPEFVSGIRSLLEAARSKRTAFMCAEAVWWRCHRGLISDYLKVNGLKVMHILSETKSEEHPYTSAARIVNGNLTYRGEDSEQNLFAC